MGGPGFAGPSAKDGDPTSLSLAAKVIERASEVAGPAPLAPGEDAASRRTLAESYARLFELLGAVPRGSPAYVIAGGGVDERRLADVAERGADSLSAAERLSIDGFSLARIRALFAWAFLICRSRAHHFDTFWRKMRRSTGRADVVVNLLVDYDIWLKDTPSPGSLQSDQVRFWTKFAPIAAPRAQIFTFAGFDPLHSALSARGGTNTYFEELKSWALAKPNDERRIAGFKIYPPMGFRVFQNPEWKAGVKYERAAAHAAAKWTEGGGDLATLHKSLDTALDELFVFAGNLDLPIVAHAYQSNDASPGAGDNASMVHWQMRIEKGAKGAHPIRALLGHYPGKSPADDAAVARILDHNLAGGSNVFFDIAYYEQLLDRPANADALLERIRELCDGDPRKAAYFCYGSDWIMLAQEPGADRYARIIDKAVGRPKSFWEPLREQFFSANLRRFLKLA